MCQTKPETPYLPKIGDVWRKHGPCDWMRIKSRQWPGFPEFDGGARGASVQMSTGRGGWTRVNGFFVLAQTPDAFASLMRKCNRELEDKGVPR
jgi:hypothetical protein